MKKLLFTVLAVTAFSLIANAQYRKSWDFTKWSDETVANLLSVNPSNSEWSDIEKADASAPTETSKNNCFWEVSSHGTAEGGQLTANGVVIKETEGLLFTHTGKNRSLAIAVNYPTALNDYQGPSYLWLGSKNINYFMIPGVEAGTTIKMGIESHKGTDARGVDLFIGNGNSGTKLLAPDGTAVPYPTTYQEFEWVVPDAPTETPNEDGTYNITVRNSNGCHIYFITVGEGDAPAVEEARNIAYVTDESTVDSDMAYIYTSALGDNVTVIPSSANVTVDSLLYYDAVVVSPFVTADAAMTPVLKSAIAYAPMLNLNTDMYAAWGLGTTNATAENVATVDAANAEEALFAGLDITAGLQIVADGGITGVTLGDYFANDVIWAKVGDAVAIHQHNPGRNTYVMLPFNQTSIMMPAEETFATLLTNALKVVSDSKTSVKSVVKPGITEAYDDKATTVTITCANGDAKVYYTIDGTEPTTASNVYTEPLVFTEPVTIKAFAVADGYYNSDVVEFQVSIYAKAAAPTISMNNEATQTTITLSCASEGADIYYSYNGISKAAEAQKYTEPIVLTEEPATIYAFAEGGSYLMSEMSSEYVSINSINANTIRIDTLAHFDANQTDWYPETPAEGGTGEAKAHYYWGKNAWEYYSTEVEREEIVKGSDGQDSVVYIYKPNAEAIKVITPNTENGWILRSQGQVLTGELTSAATNIVGNGATGYYAQTAEDMIGGGPTKGKISFGGKVSGNPYTASIETTVKYAAPFDVVVYCTNGNSKNDQVMEVQVSEDGATWTQIGLLKMAPNQRYFTKTRIAYNEDGKQVYVRLAQTGGSTKAQVYDIYILNNGEYSKKYDAGTVGIEDIQNNGETVSEEVFNINGVRLNGTRSGLNIIRKQYSDGTFKTVKVVR